MAETQTRAKNQQAEAEAEAAKAAQAEDLDSDQLDGELEEPAKDGYEEQAMPEGREPQILHRRNCPRNPNRIEYVQGYKPPNRDLGTPGEKTIVKRCLDCSRQVGIKGDVRDDG